MPKRIVREPSWTFSTKRKTNGKLDVTFKPLPSDRYLFSAAVGEELAMNPTVMRISKEQLAEMLEDKRLTLIDLRLNWEACTTKIKNAVHEDPRDPDAWSAQYDREQSVVLYCSTPEEKTSCDVARDLLEKGFTNVRVLSGGWFVWESANMPVQSKTKAPLPGKLIKGVMSD